MEESRIFREKESKFGPLIGSLIIVVVLAVGGLYFLSQRVSERKLELTKEKNDQQEVTTEMDSLEKELNELKIDEIDKGVSDIEKEFDSI
jgi:hypothetical protein